MVSPARFFSVEEDSGGVFSMSVIGSGKDKVDVRYCIPTELYTHQ